MEDDGFHHQRYVLAFMLFLAIANAYAMRAVLSLAITVMVSHEKRKSDPNACPLGAVDHVHDENTQQYEFDWDETTQGLILGSFYWGYVIMHIPGGLLAQKFGGKHTLGFGILSTAIFTILTPMAAYMGPVWLIVWRFFEGLGEGTTFPAANQLLAAWIPKTERGKVGAFVWAGIIMGTVISSSLTGLLLKLTNNYWPVVFYLFGAVAILWFVVWLFIGYSEPGSNPFISQKEMDYLEETIGSLTRRKDLPPTPWKEMATSWPVIALVITQVGHDWGLFTIAADLPKYFASVIHFSVHSAMGHDWGLFTIAADLPKYFASVIHFSVHSAKPCELLEDIDITFNVKQSSPGAILPSVVPMNVKFLLQAKPSSMGPAVGIILASYSGCNKVLAVMFFAIGMGFMGFYYPSIRINSLDLSPNYAATLMAIVNGHADKYNRFQDLPPTPWKEMATSWPVIALVITQVGHDWGLFTIAADLPKYFASVIHFSVHSNGLLSALPFLFMWIFSQGAGCLSDFIVERQWFSMTLTRKIFATAASMGPAVGIILASYSGCNKVLAVMFFAIGMGFMGFYYPSIRINSLDLSPNYAATLMAIVNGLGAVSGIFSAPLIGIMTPNSTMSEWRLVFWLTFIILAVTNLFYLVFGSAEIQPWND
ncbi:putative inorganic phosphate cotransporter, partial [Diaphorina citri]|uniref:Inorganic phosphate cotransporter n=1 Tax=Diaphorina citri TaxID=121845 RepID=A0A3Q0IWB7_DIACI